MHLLPDLPTCQPVRLPRSARQGGLEEEDALPCARDRNVEKLQLLAHRLRPVHLCFHFLMKAHIPLAQ